MERGELIKTVKDLEQHQIILAQQFQPVREKTEAVSLLYAFPFSLPTDYKKAKFFKDHKVVFIS